MKEWFIKIYGLDLSKGMAGLGNNSAGWFRILLPYQKRFYMSRVQHDYLYSIGGNFEDKIYADNLFYKLCLENSNNYLQKSFAGLYYILVQSYGYKFFNRK